MISSFAPPGPAVRGSQPLPSLPHPGRLSYHPSEAAALRQARPAISKIKAVVSERSVFFQVSERPWGETERSDEPRD